MRASDLIHNGEIVLEGVIVPTGSEDWYESGIITASLVRGALAQLQGDVVVRVNSPGGDPTEGEAIRAMLQDHAGAVTVKVAGDAASAASLMIMSADRIEMSEGSIMMIHDPSAITFGTASEHARRVLMLEELADTYAGVYAKRSGKTAAEVRQMMLAETWMGPSRSISEGFADAIAGEVVPDTAVTSEMITAGRMRHEAALSMLTRMARPKITDAANAAPGMAAAGSLSTATVATNEESEMTKPTQTPAVTPVGDLQPQAVMQVPNGAEDAVRAERARVMAIRDMAQPFMSSGALVQADVDALIDDGTPSAAAGQRFLATMAAAQGPIVRAVPATVQRDARDKFKEGAALALMGKVGLKGERNEFTPLSLSELARESLSMAGESTRFSDRRDMVGRAFTMAGSHTTSDFGNILANVMGKAALAGWDEAEETFPLWTRKGVLTDFKATKRVGAGLFSTLPELIEGADYTYGTVGDRGEEIALATYGKMLRISRQAIINDDLSILGMMPRRMGRAARRTIGNLVYAILTGNPNMADGVALFHATHANLAGAAAAPGITSMSLARTAMRTQREAAGGPVLNITPKYMIVPAALETTTAQLLNSAIDPTANKGHAANPVAGMAELIVDGRLDAASTTAWYLAADANGFDTIEVAYLDGNEAPYLEEQSAWTSDGVEMKVRVDAGVAPLDFRTLYKNAGA